MRKNYDDNLFLTCLLCLQCDRCIFLYLNGFYSSLNAPNLLTTDRHSSDEKIAVAFSRSAKLLLKRKERK